MFGESAWAAWTLEGVRDSTTWVPLTRYRDRLRSVAASGRLPENAGPLDRPLSQSARSRLLFGDKTAAQDLIPLLLSDDEYKRTEAIDAGMTRRPRRTSDAPRWSE